jgi:uncharacterized protein YpiB (UPF0302 family)
MDKSLLKKSEEEMEALNSQYAEMVLDRALHNFQKNRILKEIDQSLQDKNKEAFLRLTGELNNILKDFEELEIRQQSMV